MKLTQQTAKWMASVVDNCEKNTGRPLDAWVRLARKARPAGEGAARKWAREQGLSTVYATAVAEALFPSREDDAAMLDAQFAGPKAALRPVYDRLVERARKLGGDVEVMPRKSQVTLSRSKGFAVIRAAAKDRLDVGLKLRGAKPTARLVADRKAMASDPSHVVSLRSPADVDAELIGWLKQAYSRA